MGAEPPWPVGRAPGNLSEGAPGAFSFPGFFLARKKKSGPRRDPAVGIPRRESRLRAAPEDPFADGHAGIYSRLAVQVIRIPSSRSRIRSISSAVIRPASMSCR